MFIKKLIYVMVLVWLVVFVGSIVMSVNIEGPRNIDTGFKRLDSLFRGQILALIIAFIAMLAAFFGKENGRREKLLGLAPILLTVLAAAGLVVFALVMNNQAPPPESLPLTPTAPATALPAE